MCQEIYDLVNNRCSKKLEAIMTLQCGPFITGARMATIMVVPSSLVKDVISMFCHSSIVCKVFYRNADNTTIYIYDSKRLGEYLQLKRNEALLGACGYCDFELNSLINEFRYRYADSRMNNGEFPHEMGIFLGYPTEDVLGYIDNQGENCLYNGYWKVYSDVSSKIKIFEKYDKAKDEVARKLAAGCNIVDIIKSYCDKKKAC